MGELRVLHVTAGVAPRYGGTTTAVLGLCDALARVPGVSVELAATDADGWGRRLTGDPLAGYPFASALFPVSGPDRWQRSTGLVRWLAANVGRFDLVHSHGVWAHPAAAACRAARRAGRPVVVSPHGMLSRYTFTRNRPLKWAYWWAVERPAYRAAGAVHATTDAEAEEIARFRLPTPVRVVPLGVDAEAWTAPPRADALRARCGLGPDGPPVVLFLSRLHPKKGVTDLLLPAFARITCPAVLAIAGGTDDSAPGYLDEIRCTIDRLGLAGRVRLIGPIAPADRWETFDGAAAFVLPSHQENFGMVVAEAMARGVPVVLSDQVQIAAHVTAAGCGRVVPRDAGLLAAAIDEILSDETDRRRTGGRGRDYARSTFDWAEIAGRMAELYRSVQG